MSKVQKLKMPVKVGSTILLLNSTYEPLHLMNWKRATLLILKNKAHVVSSRTIRLKNYVKIPIRRASAGKPTRALILKRDNHICQYCEYRGPNLTLDHVVPKSRGGDDSWQNLVTSCLDCNNSKDNRTPEEWARDLKRVFNKETTNMSCLPYSWGNHQIEMLEARIDSKGTVLASKPKAPFNKITVAISTSNVPEWREYIYN